MTGSAHSNLWRNVLFVFPAVCFTINLSVATSPPKGVSKDIVCFFPRLNKLPKQCSIVVIKEAVASSSGVQFISPTARLFRDRSRSPSFYKKQDALSASKMIAKIRKKIRDVKIYQLLTINVENQNDPISKPMLELLSSNLVQAGYDGYTLDTENLDKVIVEKAMEAVLQIKSYAKSSHMILVRNTHLETDFSDKITKFDYIVLETFGIGLQQDRVTAYAPTVKMIEVFTLWNNKFPEVKIIPSLDFGGIMYQTVAATPCLGCQGTLSDKVILYKDVCHPTWHAHHYDHVNKTSYIVSGHKYISIDLHMSVLDKAKYVKTNCPGIAVFHSHFDSYMGKCENLMSAIVNKLIG